MENPVGFRFRPTDEEIIDHYLRPKNLDDDTNHVDEVINTVDICSFEPSELPSKSIIRSNDQEWYFFGRKENKHKRGVRQSRKTNSGFWKKTGVTTNIIRKRGGNHEKIGEKRILMFYLANGSKSDWVMHEYHTTFSSPVQMMTYTICKVMFKGDERELSSSSAAASGYEHNHSVIPRVNNSVGLITETEGSSFELLHSQEVQIPLQFSGSLDEQKETDDWKSYLVDYYDDAHEQSMIVSFQDDRNEFRPRKPQTGVFSDHSSDDSDSDSISAITTCSIKTSSICDSFGSSDHRIDQITDQLESPSSTIKLVSLTPTVGKTLGTSTDTSEKKSPFGDAQGSEIEEGYKMGKEMIKKKRRGFWYGLIPSFIKKIQLCSSISRT